MGRVLSSGCAVLLAVLLTGCLPSQPSASSWRTDTQTAVGDSLSSVATARTTLEQEKAGRFVGRYARVVLTYAEEAANKAAEKVSSQQPPPTEKKRWDEVTTKLDDAATLVTDTRVAVVAGDTTQYDALARRLAVTAQQLDSLQKRLKHPRAGQQ